VNGGSDGTDGSNGSDSDGCHDRAPKRTRLLANTSLRAAGNRALEDERCQQLQVVHGQRTNDAGQTTTTQRHHQRGLVREPHTVPHR
jgi:hypothetical protein